MKQLLGVLLIGFLWSIPVFAQSSRIGPSIMDELKAAGVAGLPFSWNPETGQLRIDDPRLTTAQRTAIQAVFTAHDPTKPSSGQIVATAKAKARADLIAYCADIEADMTQPVNLRTLCRFLKQAIIP